MGSDLAFASEDVGVLAWPSQRGRSWPPLGPWAALRPPPSKSASAISTPRKLVLKPPHPCQDRPSLPPRDLHLPCQPCRPRPQPVLPWGPLAHIRAGLGAGLASWLLASHWPSPQKETWHPEPAPVRYRERAHRRTGAGGPAGTARALRDVAGWEPSLGALTPSHFQATPAGPALPFGGCPEQGRKREVDCRCSSSDVAERVPQGAPTLSAPVKVPPS